MRKKVVMLMVLVVIFFSIKSNNEIIASDEKNVYIDSLIYDVYACKDSNLIQISDIMSQLLLESDMAVNDKQKYLYKQMDIVSTYDIENAYRVYVLEPLLLTAVKETGEFRSAITDVIQWKVPISTVAGESGLVTLIETDGKISYTGMSVGSANKTWYISKDNIKKAILDSDMIKTPFTSLLIVHSYFYNTTFVYLNAGLEEYVIPFCFYANECGIENGKLYTWAEIKKIFEHCFDENQILESPSNNGGVPFRQTENEKGLWTGRPIQYTIALLILVFCIGGLMVIIKERRNNENLNNGE